MKIDENRTISLSEDVMIKQIGNEMVLVYPNNAIILSINELGAEIINYILSGVHTINVLALSVHDAYEVELDIARKDITEFITKLIENKVVKLN